MASKKNIIGKFFSSRLGYTLLSIAFVVAGSYLAIQYARGNWRVTDNGVVANTGLLNANSFPTGAQVFINDKLVTATDDTIYLEPDVYQIKIIKEGYSTWKKELDIQKELVTQTNAVLFPVAPSLIPLTFTGISKLHPSPDGQKLLFYTDSASIDAKNGFYILELNSNFLSLQNSPKQLTDDLPALNLAEANIIWSPDSTELILMTTKEVGGKEFLLTTNAKIELNEQKDIAYQRQRILSGWEEEIYLKERQYLAKFPEEVIEIATMSAKNVYISPDKKRMIYTATASASIPEEIVPPIPATNTQIEERDLVPGNIYVYDREEDKNFRVLSETERPYLIDSLIATESAQLIDQDTELNFITKILLSNDLDQEKAKSLEASPTAFLRLQAADKLATAKNFAHYYTGTQLNSLQWFPDSKHLLYITENKVQVMEYDGQNNTVVYSGPLAEEFVYPWPDGSKLLIRTRFSPDSPFNLYAINLK